MGTAPETVEKAEKPLFRVGCSPLRAEFVRLRADKFHTCRLRSVFVHAPVAAENEYVFFRACGRELCEAFLTS